MLTSGISGVSMTATHWSDSLALGLPSMDDTHEEFFGLLARVIQAPDGLLLQEWQEIIAHTDAHFAREDGWMRSTGFSSSNCHIGQHHAILSIMKEGGVRGAAGELTLVRQMAHELGIWFPQHVQSMDAALALHLRGVGYDPVTGIVHMPQALPAHEIHGCGGASCSPAAQAPQEAATADHGV
jgi:hemerythrin-like metal-binding protein